MILQPVKLNGKKKIKSIRAAKYIHIGKERIPIGNVRLDVVFRTYLSMIGEEITQQKVNDFINNF